MGRCAPGPPLPDSDDSKLSRVPDNRLGGDRPEGKLIDCIAGMFKFIDVLGQHLGNPVGIELSDIHGRTSRTLYNQLDRQRTIRRCLDTTIWVIPILAGIGVSIAIAWITEGG